MDFAKNLAVEPHAQVFKLRSSLSLFTSFAFLKIFLVTPCQAFEITFSNLKFYLFITDGLSAKIRIFLNCGLIFIKAL